MGRGLLLALDPRASGLDKLFRAELALHAVLLDLNILADLLARTTLDAGAEEILGRDLALLPLFIARRQHSFRVREPGGHDGCDDGSPLGFQRTGGGRGDGFAQITLGRARKRARGCEAEFLEHILGDLRHDPVSTPSPVKKAVKRGSRVR